MKEKNKACKNCRYIFQDADVCPLCKSEEVGDKYFGEIIIFDINCEIAKKIGAKIPGNYAVRIK